MTNTTSATKKNRPMSDIQQLCGCSTQVPTEIAATMANKICFHCRKQATAARAAAATNGEQLARISGPIMPTDTRKGNVDTPWYLTSEERRNG